MADPEPLDVSPTEAIEHFRAKGFHIAFDWRDTAAAAHLRSFTVAKAMELDLGPGRASAIPDRVAQA